MTPLSVPVSCRQDWNATAAFSIAILVSSTPQSATSAIFSPLYGL